MAEYKKIEVIGSGTFGKVWLVERSDAKQKYVMKEIKVTGMSDKESEQSLREVEALAKCKHYNVIRYKDAMCTGGYLQIVMEYALGGDLQRKIDEQKEQNFPQATVLDWLVQICFGLKYIHGLHIIHRDLKTQNIFLTIDNVVKIGDFGISKILQDTRDCALTAIGTPYYLAPEICSSKPYDQKCDIWALGCVLFILCSLKPPFEAPNFSLLVAKILRGKYLPVPECYDLFLDDLVKALLRPDPAQRPTAHQVLCMSKLQPYINAYVHKSLASQSPSPTRSRSNGKKRGKSLSLSPLVRKHRPGEAYSEEVHERERSASPAPTEHGKRHHGHVDKKSCSKPENSPRSPLFLDIIEKKRQQFVHPSPTRHMNHRKGTYTVQSSDDHMKNGGDSPNLIHKDEEMISREENSNQKEQQEVIQLLMKTRIRNNLLGIDENIEQLYVFLEGKLGCKAVAEVLDRLRTGGSSRTNEATDFSSMDKAVYLPLCVQIIQLETLSMTLSAARKL